MPSFARAVLLWIAIGVVTLVCFELFGHRHKFFERPWDRLHWGERTVMVLLWPLMFVFWVAAGLQVRRDMRAQHGDEPDDKDPPP